MFQAIIGQKIRLTILQSKELLQDMRMVVFSLKPELQEKNFASCLCQLLNRL